MSATHCPHCGNPWDTHGGTQIGMCIHGTGRANCAGLGAASSRPSCGVHLR